MSTPELKITAGPTPSDEELAAIMAAVQVVTAGSAAPASPTVDPAPRWRFSGRWWAKPVPSRRDRPFAG